MKLLDIIESIVNDPVYYHGTGNLTKVIDALNSNTFISHKSGGVENGIFITPNIELATKYAEQTGGDDIGVVKLKFRSKPQLKKYHSSEELYNDEKSYDPFSIKQSIIKFREALLKDGYDGFNVGHDIILIFKERMDILNEIENDMDEPLDEVTYRYKEGRNTVPNRMDFDTQKLIDSGAIVICKGMNGDPKSPDYKKHLNDGSSNLITLYNIEHALKKSPDSWILEAIKYPITIAPMGWKNMSLETYDGKYNQILWSLKKLGISYNDVLK